MNWATVRLGHFYNRYAARDVRQKYENRANKWAIKKLIPEDELKQAILQGCREPWELAEYFGVTEAFYAKLFWYKHGYFDTHQGGTDMKLYVRGFALCAVMLLLASGCSASGGGETSTDPKTPDAATSASGSSGSASNVNCQ